MDQTKKRLPRCPNGTTRNKKSGNCEPKVQPVAAVAAPPIPIPIAEAASPNSADLAHIMEHIDTKIAELKQIRKQHIDYINTRFPDLKTNNAETEHFDMMYDRWVALNLDDLTVERAKKFVKKMGNKKNKALIMGLFTDELLRK